MIYFLNTTIFIISTFQMSHGSYSLFILSNLRLHFPFRSLILLQKNSRVSLQFLIDYFRLCKLFFMIKIAILFTSYKLLYFFFFFFHEEKFWFDNSDGLACNKQDKIEEALKFFFYISLLK